VEFLLERNANDGSVVVQFRRTWYANEDGKGVERPFHGWLMPLNDRDTRSLAGRIRLLGS
jgi:hypothetical protein